MNKRIQYISLGISAVLLMSIGLILDRVGGLSIRTDDVSSSVDLAFSEPVLRGIPTLIRWQTNDKINFGVGVRLVSGEETFVLGTGEILARTIPITIPCKLPPAPFRLELIDTISGSLLGVREINVLPPGPDCVG